MIDFEKPMLEESAHCDDPSQPIPDVSVVIVSWNVAALLADCLDSLVQTSEGIVLEVWVVDNASSDNTVEMLRTRYSWVHLIANEDNRGFARANNQAIRQARGRFALILNPDTIVRPGVIQGLMRYLETHSDVGMVGPCLRDLKGDIDGSSARRMYTMSVAICLEMMRLHKLPWIGPVIQRRLYSPYDFAATQEVEAISGAAMLVRRELLEKLQGFGDSFLHFGEDVDLCFRIRAAGWKLVFDASVTMIHIGGQSTKQTTGRMAVNGYFSNQEFFRRCYGRWHALLYRLIAQCICVPQLLVMGCIQYVLGRESGHSFRNRLSLVWHLIRWQADAATSDEE